MPRGIPNPKVPATAMPKTNEVVKSATPALTGIETRLKKTTMNHIYFYDPTGDGKYHEIAVVKMLKNHDQTIRSLYYIEVMLLDNVDKGRLKGVVTSQHADKYELWDLLSQNTLSNGLNALDYFHQLTRVVHGAGSTNTQLGGGLMSVKSQSGKMIGAEYTDPSSGALETQPIN